MPTALTAVVLLLVASVSARARAAAPHPLPAGAAPASAAASVSVLPVVPGIDMLTVDGVNVAVNSGPEGVIVVDTGPASVAPELLAAIKNITHEPIRYVIDTSGDSDLIGGDAVEVDEREPDRVHERDLGRPRLQPYAHALEFVLERAPRDVVLGREVAEERPPPDARRRRDVLDRGLLEPVRLEQLERHVLQLGLGGGSPPPRLAAALRWITPGCGRCCRP